MPRTYEQLTNIMTEEHKKALGKHFIEIGYKLAKDKSGKTIDDVIADMKNVFTQLKNLKQHYEVSKRS